VLNPGVDVAGFYPNVDTSKVRHKYELDGRRVLLTVARLETRKNVESVLRALPKVVVKVPNILYLVVGDGEERERLEALCDDLGLGPYVRFLGYIENSQLPALYCASDVFVLLSIETFGISFIEASACAKPVVCGSSGAATEAVIHGETGLIVNTHNLDEIATAIVCLLTNQELARRLGENGRRRVEQKFTWEQVSKQLVIYFETVKR
jgi:phosphatidylinositol alpha-1,6-mannosyltransferase